METETVPLSVYKALVEVNDQIIATTRTMLDTADLIVQAVEAGMTEFEEGRRGVRDAAIAFKACRESIDRLAAERPNVGPRHDA